ncbi:Maf family protein [Chelatococcus reniformis]|uniref:Nucleoside triphosphate pyrophosphatase n=1 Tax=Chelatococcus reniformis TaxID=1494448 RepID=A0A916X8D5_9HYPH|nr:Maf family protein [Chelatococcus reniformis]GGC51628.1 Maf-like protein [Chelatococcus reniformis]
MTDPFWLDAEPLLLASTSATRRDMLRAAGLPVETTAPLVDERAIDGPARSAGTPAAGIAALLAREKALAVSRRHPERLVLGADQTLACAGRVYDKPADATAAAVQLATLAGRSHTLHSAAALARDGRVLAELNAEAELVVRPLSDAFIARYIARVGEAATRSVGGYQVEGLGVQLFEAIRGDHFTILGLPLLPLLEALRRLGALAR